MSSVLTRVLRIHPSRLATAPALGLVEATAGRATVRIDGLVCGLCAARTQQALAAVPGVEAASVDLGAGRAEVWYATDGVIDEAALRRALDSVVVAAGMRRWIERAMRAVPTVPVLGPLRSLSSARSARAR